MAYMQVWVAPEKVLAVKANLDQFVRYKHDFYEIEANELGGNVALLVYKRVPGRFFLEEAIFLDVKSINRMNKYREKSRK